MYCAGLLIFYVFLSLSEWDSVPNWVYYLWDKSAGCGFLLWICLYKSVRFDNRKIVNPLVWFSILRFLLDVVGFIGGPTAASEPKIAVLFIALVVVFYVLTLRNGAIFDKWLTKVLIN